MVKTHKKDNQLTLLVADIILIAFLTSVLMHLINVKNGKSHYIFIPNIVIEETKKSVTQTLKEEKLNSGEDVNSEEYAIRKTIRDFMHNYIEGNELLIFFSFIYVLAVTSTIARNIGRFGAKIHYAYYKHYLKRHNPNQYLRELPNNFGVAIASLITDSTIENKKDIIAVILDLCAKGYLELEKEANGNYSIKILNNDINNLLSNEQYVIKSIIDGKMRNFDYNQWYNYCRNDAIRLGLIIENNSNNINWRRKKSLLGRIFKISVAIISIGVFIWYYNAGQAQIPEYSNNVLIIIIYIIASIMVGLFSSVFVVMIAWPFCAVISTIKNSIQSGYRSEKNRRLNLTEYGKAEVKKLFAFEAFLKDFGLFASKNPEEILLWDYYLSYAQVFGLTDEILKNGYKDIIRKGSIQIEDINTINVEKFIN